MESLTFEMNELNQARYKQRIVTEQLTIDVLELQERINSSLRCSTYNSSNRGVENAQLENKCREQDIVKKGMERIEKEIAQYTQVKISRDKVDIALVKKCKMTDIPAVNVAIANIQRALQKYVGFKNIDLLYCDKIGEVMDNAQAWCMNIEDMYIKAEVHSINTSKGHTADVGIFSDNAKETVFEFLEAAELAYLGWGNSKQKANRLYNKHLSEEIRSQLISLSDDYRRMKSWLIENFGSPSRIVGDIIGDLSRKGKPVNDNRKQKFFFLQSQELYKGLKDWLE